VTSEGTLTDEHKSSRWFKAVGSLITRVEKVSVQSDMLLEGYAPKTEAEWAEHAKLIWPTTYTVIHTAKGSACVVDFQSGSDIAGVIVSRGRKPKALTLGTWRKYGSKRGHGMAWLRAEFGLGRCTSPEAGRDVCAGEAYGRLGSVEFAWGAQHAL